MSAVTVTYHELPPLNSWASDNGLNVAQDETNMTSTFIDNNRPQTFHDTNNSWNNYNSGAMHSTAELTSTTHWTHNPPVTMSVGNMEPPPYITAAYHSRSPVFSVNATGAAAGGDFRNPNAKKRITGIRAVQSSNSSNCAPEELCLVCGDKASGYHYNALTCEGCKGFFRRSITRKAVYYCKYGGNCDIDMYMRRKCQCCRLRKCMDIGMRPERLRPDTRLPLVVIPEDQCRIKREAKIRMRTITNATSNGTSPEERKSSCSPQQVTSTEATPDPYSAPGLTLEQRELVNRLVTYQQQFDMPTDEAMSKLSTFSNGNGQQKMQPFQHLAELTILSVQLIMEFTKHLPGYATLSNDDQLTLQKACATEVLMLRTARRYDPKTDTIVLGNQTTSWTYNRETYKQAGIGSLTDAIFDFAKSMAKMKVDSAEYALLTAIAIFSERPGLLEQKKVEDIQEVYTSTLQTYIDVHRPKTRTVFARLLMKLTDLRTLGSEHADMLCALKIDSNPSLGGGEIKADMRKRSSSSTDVSSVGEESNGNTNGYRMPNVRIKVEPLQSASTPPNGYTSSSEPTKTYSSLITQNSYQTDHGGFYGESQSHPNSNYGQDSGDLLEQAVINSFPELNNGVGNQDR